MAAAWPYCDAVVSAHNFEALGDLLDGAARAAGAPAVVRPAVPGGPRPVAAPRPRLALCAPRRRAVAADHPEPGPPLDPLRARLAGLPG